MVFFSPNPPDLLYVCRLIPVPPFRRERRLPDRTLPFGGSLFPHLRVTGADPSDGISRIWARFRFSPPLQLAGFFFLF